MKGMTFVELMTAIAIMLIATEGITVLFVKVWDNNKFIIEEAMASAAASRATNQIIIQLRGIEQAENGDYAIESADDFDLTIYADADDDGVVERVHYFLDDANDQLKKGMTEPTTAVPPTYPAGDQTVTVMANYVVNESDNPIFFYYNGNYPGDTVNNPLATPTGAGSIRLIQVHLFVNINPVHAPDNINIESFVTLRNLHTYE